MDRFLRRIMRYFPMGRISWGKWVICLAIHPYHMAFGGLDDKTHRGMFLGPIGWMKRK